MLKRNLWKLIFSFVIVVWAAWTLYPLSDQDIGKYAREHATAKKGEFAALVSEANELHISGKAPSTVVGLRQIAHDRKIDLAQYFPDVNLGTLRNLDKRNATLLDYLFKESKGKLQLGLDLRGGVGLTREASQRPTTPGGNSANDEREQMQKLDKAIEILNSRLNGSGVTEPVIRAVGNSRIEIQMPGLNTKENPDVLNAIQKPARLDFRIVSQDFQPSREEPPPGSIPPGYEVLSTDEDDRRTGETYQLYYVVKRLPEMTGSHISRAGASMDQYGGNQVNIAFDSEGAKEFGRVTGAN